MPSTSEDGYWAVVDDFDPASCRSDVCSVSGTRKRSGDIGVFRPIVNGMIAFEGYFDISQYAIEKAAEMLGWISPEAYAELQAENHALREEGERVMRESFKKAADAVKMAGVRAARADA